MTYADVLRPSVKRYAATYDAALVLGGSAVLALSAQVAFFIGPVPITGQTLAVLLVGALLGSRRGALCILAYLAEGAMGLPVFAGGRGGIPVLIGPTGGYLVGFVAAAFLVGMLAERGWDRRVGTTLAAILVGNAALYAFGLAWLSRFVGSERVLSVGLIPFIPGDLLKAALAAVLLPSGWKLLGRASS